MLKLKTTMLCAMLLLAFATACDQKADDGKMTITVIPKGTSHVFWQSIHAGAEKAGQEFGVNILWVGSPKEDDRQEQIALVDNQVINQVDGILLAPTDDMALRRPVKNAAEKGIPVIIIDSELKNSQEIYTSFVATDNFKGGKLGGTQLCELLGGKGKVIMLRYSEGSASTEKREAGFIEALKDYPDIELVSDEQRAGVTTATAQAAAENLLLRFKNDAGELTIDGIFCVNESTTHGMLMALRRQRLSGNVTFVGFDAAETLIDGVKKDEIHGLVVQNPFNMGYIGTKTMIEHLRGNPVEKRIDTGVHFVTKENLEQPDIQTLVFPDLDKWLSGKK